MPSLTELLFLYVVPVDCCAENQSIIVFQFGPGNLCIDCLIDLHAPVNRHGDTDHLIVSLTCHVLTHLVGNAKDRLSQTLSHEGVVSRFNRATVDSGVFYLGSIGLGHKCISRTIESVHLLVLLAMK